MTLTRERLGALVAISIVAISTLLVLVISKMFNLLGSELVPLAFLPGLVANGVGLYKVITRKDTSDGCFLIVTSLGLITVFCCIFLIPPALQTVKIHIYSQNITLIEYNIPFSNDKIVFVKLKVTEAPKTYHILVHNSGNRFMLVKLEREAVQCSVLSGKLVYITLDPIEQWVAPRETKSLKLTVYSNVNYTDTCTIRLIFEIN